MDGRTKEARKAKKDETQAAGDLLSLARKRYKIMAEDDRHNREDALEDLRFCSIPGAQWNENMKLNRGDRPAYEYNKVRVRCKRIINDMRDNRPSGKVRGTEDADVDTAEIYEGLIRNIWASSHADNATDYAAEYQVQCGMGAWRVNTQYSSDTAFEQDIVIEMIENPFSLYCDPSAKGFMKRDARDWIYTTRMSYAEYEEEYPGKDKVDFESDNEYEDDSDDQWTDEETVRIAEYWYKVPIKKTLLQVEVPDPDNEGQTKTLVVDSLSDEARGIPKDAIKNTREVDAHQIMMVVLSGQEILEGPVKWAGHMFPWVMVHGEYMVIEGRTYWWGLVRFAKDAQRSFNVSKTAIAETIAQAPKGKWWATSKQAAGHTDEWAEADRKNFPYLLYEADPQAPGAPPRMGAADVPVALMQQSAQDDEDLKDVMGLPDASMGASGDEKSGRAIYARQQQGEVATFNYRDNMSKAVELTMEILIDLIPEIYDAEREMRILGIDGAETYKRINQMVMDPATGKMVRINDMSTGKYDVTVTTGPAFSTQRQEAAEMYMGLTSGMPEIMQMAGDLIFKAVDLPYADEISERFKAMLPPQIQQMLQGDEDMPPEVMQMMQQAEQAMQQVQEHGQLVQAAAAELEQDKSLNAQQKAEIKTMLAQLKQAEAEFKTLIAEQTSGMIEKAANLTQKEASLTVKGSEVKEAAIAAGVSLDERDNSALDLVQRVDELFAKHLLQVDEALGVINKWSQKTDARIYRKVTGGTSKREGGRIVATVNFDDGSSESLSGVREKDGLTIVPTKIEPN